MRELIFELALRLLKPVLAGVIGLVAWILATGPGGAPQTAELALLCFVTGVAIILLVQEGPI